MSSIFCLKLSRVVRVERVAGPLINHRERASGRSGCTDPRTVTRPAFSLPQDTATGTRRPVRGARASRGLTGSWSLDESSRKPLQSEAGIVDIYVFNLLTALGDGAATVWGQGKGSGRVGGHRDGGCCPGWRARAFNYHSTAQTTKGPTFSMATPNRLLIPEATLAAKWPWSHGVVSS